MDVILDLSNLKQVAKTRLEKHVLKSYREDDEVAVRMMEQFFRENNAMHLFRPYIGPSNKPLMRIFNSLSIDEKRLLMNDFEEYDFHFSKTYTDKTPFKTALKEMSFSYITDFCRNYTDNYVCVTSDFRPKVLKNFPCHMCSSWKEDGDAQERVIDQLEFFKTFKFAKEEYNIRMGLNRLVKRGVLDENIFCSNPGSCSKIADTLIVDHIENYMTMEQVLLKMLQHKSSRALGFFFLPDGIDYKKKGSFYEDNLYFDRSLKSMNNVNEPVLFYDKNRVFSECIYPWIEYKKFFETTLIVHNGKMYRYEIVNRTHGIAFYSISYDGEYDASVNVPTYQLSHYVECYEVSSYRPEHNVFGKNFSNFVKKTAYIPSLIYAKVYEFALTLGMKDFSRKEIHERLCASFMRVQNAATGAVTQFDPQLDVESIDIAADAIWTAAFLKRRQNAEILASQKFLNQKFGNTGFNLETLKNYLSICVDENNPFRTIMNMYEMTKEKFYEDKFSEYLPSSIYHGKHATFGGIEYLISLNEFKDFNWFNSNYIPPWFKVYLKLRDSDDVHDVKRKEILYDLKRSNESKFDSIIKSPYYYFIERDRPVDDSIHFFSDEIIVLHDEPLLTDGERAQLLNRLNLATDANESTLKKISILTESKMVEPYSEPITFHPLRPLNDVVTSLRMAVAYVSEDVRPLLNTKFDMYDTNTGDYDCSIEADVVMNTFKRKFLAPTSFLAMPRIQSHITKSKNPPEHKNTLMAFNKRNFNVPILEEVTNQLQKVGSTVENMFNCLCVPGWSEILEKDFGVHKIHHFFDTNAQYVSQLAPGKAKRFNLDELVSPDLWVTNEFKKHTNILKSDTKFSLTGEIQDEYTVNSTINFHGLEVNAISSSIFRNIVKRLHAILRPEVCMMIEKDRVAIEKFFYSNFSKDKFDQDSSGYLSLEIDYSKFDKSQKERCAMIEMFIYTRLGLNEDFANIWFESLEDMTTINYHDMIKAHWKWQRRTGTATTALGNTLVTMATVCTVLFPDFKPIGFESPFKCASFLGDDSLIIVNKNVYIPGEISEKLNLWYNLSAKFDIKDHLYFCSAFIVYIKGKGCKMIPDPKKRVLSLTKPLDSEPSEVFRSLRDACVAYLEDEEYINVLSQGMSQRYHVDFEKCLFTCRVLTTVLSRYENYLEIYDFKTTSIYG